MNSETSFGSWVKVRRKTLDMTQKELAHRIGCSLSIIQKIEIDERQPSRQIAELLTHHLEIAEEYRNAFLQLARARSVEPQPIPTATQPLPQRINNLPSPLTGLIGREWEVETLRAILLRDDVRLLTISGPPGIGKTRIGLQVAKTILEHFSDGVCFVALAPISGANFVIPTIARALTITERERQPLLEQLKAYLRNKQLLLVLDNFEHVLAGAPLVAELLERAPSLKVLVTSRALLHLYGEHEFVMPRLALPDLKHLPAPDVLISYAAVDLFVQRARAAKLEFVLSEQNARSVAELCIHLDGLPLAIELAAARSKQLSPEALLVRLIDPNSNHITRFGVLTGDAPNLPPRQQALHNAIEWSYNLLTQTEQRVFRSLGVFASGCTLAALNAVNGQPFSPDTDGLQSTEDWLLHTVHSLVNKSLVVLQPGMGEEPRFTLLEMIREYALEQLALSGETERIHQAHAHYFLRMGEILEAKANGVQRNDLWTPFPLEQDNMRAALRWALAHDAAAGLYLAAAIGEYWNNQGLFGETRQWLEQLLAEIKPEGSRRYAYATRRLGICLWQQGDYLPAQSWLNKSIACWRGLENKHELGISLQFLALVLYHQDEYEAALLPVQEAVALLRTQQDLAWLAISLDALGNIYSALGDYATTRTVLEEALVLFQQRDDSWGVALALLGLADIPYAEGDYVTARGYLEEALQIYRSMGERWLTSQTLWYLGKVLWQQAEWKQAVACWEESIVVGRAMGAKEFVAGSLLLLGFAAYQARDIPQAHALFNESLTIYRQMEHNAGIGYALSGLAGVIMLCAHAEIAQHAKAAQMLGAATRLLASRRKLLDDIEREHHVRIVAAVRTQIDEATFATAWAEGETMSLDQCLLAVADATDWRAAEPSIDCDHLHSTQFAADRT